MATKHVVNGDQYRIIDRKMREIKRQLDQNEGSPLNPDVVSRALQEVIDGYYLRYLMPDYPVIVDYDLSLVDMIGAGNYSSVESDITAEHFPIEGKGRRKVNLKLVHFNMSITKEEVLEGIKKQSLRPGRIEELLAFGTAYPEIHSWFPVLCPGSVYVDQKGRHLAPVLDPQGVDPYRLGLFYFDNKGDREGNPFNWHARYRFLAVAFE